MLDHQHRIAQIAQILPTLARVGHCRGGAGRSKVHQARTARLSALIRSGWPDGCVVPHPQKASQPSGRVRYSPVPPLQELQPLYDLVHDASSNRVLASRQLDFPWQFQRTRNRKLGKICDRQSIHFHCQTLGTQPLPVTGGTFRRRHVIEQEITVALGRGFL